jgi:histidine ammonia-lyase
MVSRLRSVLACELVAAVRALRQRGAEPSGARLRAVYGQCLRDLPADDRDRALDTDLAAAERVITAWAEGRPRVTGQTASRATGGAKQRSRSG